MWGLRLECCKKCGCTFQIRRGYYEGYGGWYDEDGLCYWCKREETVGKEQTDDEFDEYCECNDLVGQTIEGMHHWWWWVLVIISAAICCGMISTLCTGCQEIRKAQLEKLRCESPAPSWAKPTGCDTKEVK